jgi:flagellar motor switch protein FliG
MVLLGDDAAMGICRHLPQEELRLLAQEISELDYIPPEMATEVLQEYQRSTSTQQSMAKGGTEYATKVFVKAFGDEGSKPLVNDIIRSQEAAAQTLEALQKADPQQLAKLLGEEHPQTIALVLSHLSGEAAKAVLLLLPEAVRGQAVKRLAQMQDFSPEVFKKISVVLHRKLQTKGEQERRPYGGTKAAADLLNRVGAKVTTELLAGIEQDDAPLATSIRNLMFTFEDFVQVPETGLRELLAGVDKKTLATALKNASEDLQNAFFKCMSSRAVEMLKEDTEALGAIRAKDISQARTEIIAVARKLESEGKLMLRNEVEEANAV